MIGGLARPWLVLAMSVAAAGVPFGCGESKSSSSEPSRGGGSSGASGNGSGGSVVVLGGSGGAATCPTGGSGATGSGDGGQAGDGALACGLIVYPSRVYGTECQGWMEENCCPLLEACAANPTCKTLVDCVNACDPPTSACVGCCGTGLVEAPAELDAIAACTKSGAVMPEGCDWPPSERR